MYTYKINNKQLETYEDETLVETSSPLDFADWDGFVYWVEHFTTTAPWSADFLYQCYQQDKQTNA